MSAFKKESDCTDGEDFHPSWVIQHSSSPFNIDNTWDTVTTVCVIYLFIYNCLNRDVIDSGVRSSLMRPYSHWYSLAKGDFFCSVNSCRQESSYTVCVIEISVVFFCQSNREQTNNGFICTNALVSVMFSVPKPEPTIHSQAYSWFTLIIASALVQSSDGASLLYIPHWPSSFYPILISIDIDCWSRNVKDVITYVFVITSLCIMGRNLNT